MRIGSLFSGYGGLDLAVQSVLGGDIAWHVEYDKAPSRILDHHFPGVPNYGDVTKLDFTSIEPVDVLTGGYPCQPFSHAGMRKGTNDERHLWPHVLRAIRDLGPRLAVLENVRGHLTLGFETVLSDVADIGWSAEWVVVRASDAGACHQRARLFILAYPENVGHEWIGSARGRRPRFEDGHSHPFDTHHSRLERAKSEERQLVPAGSSTSDADFPGGQARRDTGHDGQRIRVKPLGLANALANAESDQQRKPAKPRQVRHEPGHGAGTDWGQYGPAIRRWETVIGRPAPAPTEPGRTGAPRLSPAFVEWMMGLPDGWVTDPAIGISRNDQLKALGNGVVPQQAALALDVLLQRTSDDLRQTLAPL